MHKFMCIHLSITEHTAFNCYVANVDQPLELNISCSSPPPDRRSHSTKGQISKIKIVQGVYGYSQYPGKLIALYNGFIHNSE